MGVPAVVSVPVPVARGASVALRDRSASSDDVTALLRGKGVVFLTRQPELRPSAPSNSPRPPPSPAHGLPSNTANARRVGTNTAEDVRPVDGG
ncbi:hypothetical protein AAFF_G00113430 [Aldrovandia affinis]|uniref:Uncharacterized protein n=1 Tax=Aldrovandia affinis TaxID=143900 RepID=A0AAD7RT28_9TELE|nr:hypothetical protein AAFF_G00113430 [Aldrovandia affinis]